MNGLNLNKIIKKYANNKGLYIIIIIGIVFMLIPTGGKKQEDIKETAVYGIYSDEERLERLLGKVSGVEEVSVMITYCGTSSYDVAFEKKQTSSKRPEESTESAENSAVISGGEPLILGEVYPKARGVVIIARGAKNAEVKKAITDAAVAALDIAPYKVCVLEGKERN